ncbi:hypothetical protein FHW58_003410 [Duganella sp. 1224]|uniref:hypothetical protein n=1 Tax=Duganella sp. 1224 TaxID=2587052 RepID=UPI0015C767CA|nr:hypothetical protein [Duganella sp. 1224]NYE62195.1 hypothetical protein [Duganella sp. 1224]
MSLSEFLKYAEATKIVPRLRVTITQAGAKPVAGDTLRISVPAGWTVTSPGATIDRGAGPVTLFSGLGPYPLQSGDIPPIGQSWPVVATGTLSQVSSPTFSISNPIVVPDAPTMGTATAGSSTVSVPYADGSNGGAAITSHDLQIYDGSGAYIGTITGVANPAVLGSSQGILSGGSYKFKARANNSAGPGPYSIAFSNTVVPGVAPPIITAAPTLNMTPTANNVLSAVAGTATGTYNTDLLVVFKDGVNVGQDYLVTTRDVQCQFQAVWSISNAAGIDAASSATALAIQDPTLAPAWSQIGGTGLPVHPYLMCYQATAGEQICLNLGQRTSGATIAAVVWEVETGVGTGVYAPGAGTSVTTPYYAYTSPSNGSEAGRRLRPYVDLGGTGSTPEGRWYVDPVMIVPSTPSSGVYNFASASNRLGLTSQTDQPLNISNATSYKILSNESHIVGSGAINSIVFDVAALTTDSTAQNTIPLGNIRRIEAADTVYNGVVVPLKFTGTFNGVVFNNETPTTAKPLEVDSGAIVSSDPYPTSAYGAAFANGIPAGQVILGRTRSDVPAGTKVPCAESGDDISWPSQHYWYTTSDTVTNDVGNTNAGNNYRVSATGGTVSFRQAGPKLVMRGRFVSADPIIIGSITDSRGAQGGTSSIHFTVTMRNAGKPPIAGCLIGRSSTNASLFINSSQLQAYSNYANTWQVEPGINSIGSGPNSGSAAGLISNANSIWTGIKNNYTLSSGRRALRIYQLSLMYHFLANNPDSSTFSNTIASRQTSYPQLDKGGDIQQYFVPAMQAAVTANTITGYIEHRNVVSLSYDPNNPNYYKARASYYADTLHQGDARVHGRYGYSIMVG